MRSARTMVIAAMLACTVATYGQSVVVYSVETGGNNHAADWENFATPAYTSGVTDGSTVVTQGSDLNWAVRVSVGGTHAGDPGDGMPPLGAANLVFDLVVLQADQATVTDLGAAPMDCAAGAPGQAGALNCGPTGKGFWSSINDGDADGARGNSVQDLWANAALSISIYNTLTPPATLSTLASPSPAGPFFDYGWYPTANLRGGVDLAGAKKNLINTTIDKPELDGKLVGFGAGYKTYNYATHRIGVGMFDAGWSGQQGFGANVGDPEFPAVAERPLFEGQISTMGMAPGTYYLKVIPSANGTNVLHGGVVWDDPAGNYSGAGSFAAKANSAITLAAQANGVKFVVAPAPAPTITTTCPLAGGTVGSAYAPVTLTATGGAAPYVWSISAGALPAGLNLTAGVISGTPTAAGTANFTIRVTGSNALFSELACSIAVAPPAVQPSVVGRKIFYNNSYHDGNKATIDDAPIAGIYNDDADAIDTTKSPLMGAPAHLASYANYTNFAQGINGLIYDIQDPDPANMPVASDFVFTKIGRNGLGPNTVVTPNSFKTYQLSVTPNVLRCVMTFTSTGGASPSGSIQNTWLQVDTGAGFGAPAETHYWGNARMESNTLSGLNCTVDATDEIGARNNAKITKQVPSFTWDYNKDGLVNSTDQILARNNKTSPSTVVVLITK